MLPVRRETGRALVRAILAVVVMVTLVPSSGVAQSYEEVEGKVRRQIEVEGARAIGECTEVMLSWLGMRFSDVDRKNGKARAACDAAQLFSFRNGVSFEEALPKVADAMGGTLRQPCPSYAADDPKILLYSACFVPRPPRVPPPPTAYDLARAKEVRELGPIMLLHLSKCVVRPPSFTFAFNVTAEGRAVVFNYAGYFGHSGASEPSPAEVQGLKRIERIFGTDPRCSTFPENLRRRYVEVQTVSGRMKVAQVRDDAAHPW